jgi:hypothetical protein
MSSRTSVHLLTIYLEDAQWSLNGIATGAGKSVVISQTAHYLASLPEIKKVVVLTPNNLLQ